MAKGGPSISVKMILTTTLLIAAIAVGDVIMHVNNIRHAYDDAAQEQVDLFKRDRETLGALGTPLFARAVEQLLIDRGRDADILSLVQAAVTQDTKDGPNGKKDYGLRLAYVLDLHQNVVAHCFEAKDLECTEGNHEPLTPALGELTMESWKKALATWSASTNGGGPMVQYELTSGGSTYRMFAYAVFVGEPATPAGAVAADPPAARLGYVVLGYDLSPVQWFIEAASAKKSEASTKAAIYAGAIGALFVLIGVVLAIFQGLAISRPIKLLAWKADQIARGDLDARVEVKSGDELGQLGVSFNFMADQINVLLQQTAEKAKIEQELEVAKTIQETLVPSPEPVTFGPLTFAGYYLPAAQTGGDWWTWSELASGKISIVIGDVTGHGVPSAMLTAAAKAACDVARHLYNDEVTVTRLLEIMNYAIYESAQRKFVMTCFASIIDIKKKTITYANAGHNFPYLYRASDGKGEFGSLMIRGHRLGDDPNSKYEAKTTELLSGDLLVWYTDGIVECENSDNEEYGERRFRASVRKSAIMDPPDLRDAIVSDAAEYYGDTPRRDDITMVIGKLG
jgi:serine phosphatase RsbU (regulator of sigma subunit)